MEFRQLLDILEDLHPEVNFDEEDKLIDNKILTSFDIVSIIAEVNNEYDITIPAGKIVPENFNSAKALFDMIKSIEDED